MIHETIIEYSESISSPSGAYSVAVSSSYQTSKPNQGSSQALVTAPMGGSGLIAFPLPRVSMGFVWNSDEELVVRYPKNLPVPRIDATNISFGRGGRGRVIYKAVPQNEIRPLRWTRGNRIRTLAEENLERGVLITFKIGDHLEYSYSYYDVNEPDSSHEILESSGLQGGGYSWEGIVRGLVALRASEIMEFLDFEPEGDGLAIQSTNRDALVTVAQLVAASKQDRSLLDEAIKRAIQDGQIE